MAPCRKTFDHIGDFVGLERARRLIGLWLSVRRNRRQAAPDRHRRRGHRQHAAGLQ